MDRIDAVEGRTAVTAYQTDGSADEQAQMRSAPLVGLRLRMTPDGPVADMTGKAVTDDPGAFVPAPVRFGPDPEEPGGLLLTVTSPLIVPVIWLFNDLIPASVVAPFMFPVGATLHLHADVLRHAEWELRYEWAVSTNHTDDCPICAEVIGWRTGGPRGGG